MGPEGGSKGGRIIAVGDPEAMAEEYKSTGSYTGEYLKKELELHKL
jgi:excinuclease ABC subunit A